MHSRRVAVVAVLFASGALYAADAPASQPALQAIRYERTGGFTGTHDVVEITPAGVIVVQGKMLKSGKGQLNKEQLARLAILFDGWKDLKASYPAPPGSADGFAIKLRYGDKEVAASDMNQDLPQAFKAGQAAIEELAKKVGGNN